MVLSLAKLFILSPQIVLILAGIEQIKTNHHEEILRLQRSATFQVAKLIFNFHTYCIELQLL